MPALQTDDEIGQWISSRCSAATASRSAAAPTRCSATTSPSAFGPKEPTVPRDHSLEPAPQLAGFLEGVGFGVYGRRRAGRGCRCRRRPARFSMRLPIASSTLRQYSNAPEHRADTPASRFAHRRDKRSLLVGEHVRHELPARDQSSSSARSVYASRTIGPSPALLHHAQLIGVATAERVGRTPGWSPVCSNAIAPSNV